MVPDTADQIPAAVLASPMIGELRRFDGSAVPSGWMFSQGQSIGITENPRLFGVLGSIAGGDGRTVFKLPNTPYGAIIAVAGIAATSPAMLAASTRRTSAVTSLGPNASVRPKRPRTLSAKRQADLAAQRQVSASAVRASFARPSAVSPALVERFGEAVADARTAALGVLGASTRARLEAALDAAASGRISINDAVNGTLSSLTSGEAVALLGVSDAMTQPFGGAAASRSGDARNDAAHFVVSVAFSPEQLRALRRLERSRA